MCPSLRKRVSAEFQRACSVTWGQLITLSLSSCFPFEHLGALSGTEMNARKRLNNSVMLSLQGKAFLNSFWTQTSWNITGSQRQLAFPSYTMRSLLNKNYQVPLSLWEEECQSFRKVNSFSGEHFHIPISLVRAGE